MCSSRSFCRSCLEDRFTFKVSEPARATRRHSWNCCPASSSSQRPMGDRKSTRLNSSHSQISYAVFCLKKKKKTKTTFPNAKNTYINDNTFACSVISTISISDTHVLYSLDNQSHCLRTSLGYVSNLISC